MNQALGLNQARETEQERLIRLGEMTPFGTVIAKTKPPDATQPQPSTVQSSAQPSTSKMSDFELFLASQDERPISRSKFAKTTSKVEKSAGGRKSILMEPLTETSTLTFSRERGSPTSGQGGNYFDATKPRHVVREADFSQLAVSKPKYRKLEHNFTSDAELSDVDSGSGDDYKPSKEDWKSESGKLMPAMSLVLTV